MPHALTEHLLYARHRGGCPMYNRETKTQPLPLSWLVWNGRLSRNFPVTEEKQAFHFFLVICVKVWLLHGKSVIDQGLAYWWGVHLRWQSCLMYRITGPAERGSCVYLNPSSRHSDHSWQTGDRYCQSALFLKPPTLLCVFCKFGGVPASWPAEWHSLPGSEDSWASRRRDIQRLLPWYCWPRQKPAWLLEKARIVLVSTGLGRKVESGHRCGEKNVSLQRVCLFSLTKQ